MATFSVRFLGCKVSHADAQEIRERLLADGHAERDGAPTSRSSTPAASRTRRCASRARPPRARRARTGASTSPAAARTSTPTRSPGCRRTSSSSRAAARRRRRSVARRRRRDRLRPGRRAARPRPRVREGAGRLQLLVQLLRDPARARRLAQPPRRGGARARSAAASSRATARSCSPGSTSAATATARPATALPRLVREAGATPGLARLRLSSIEVNHVDDEARRGAARDADGRAPPARAAAVRRRRRPARDGPPLRRRARTCAGSTPLGDFNLTTDVIVGFPAEDERAFRRTLAVVRGGRRDEGARLPVLAAARARPRRRRTRSRAR